MSIKDYFYFTKSQRNGIIILIIILVIIVGANIYIEQLKEYPKKDIDDTYQNDINKFLASLKEIDNKHQNSYKNKKHKSFEPKYWRYKEPVYFDFDPNTLDSTGFSSLGLKNWMIKNILKFRARGGKFHKSEDFKNVYGLSDKKFKELEAYIKIAELPKQNKLPINIETIELNHADSTELCKIDGIYPKLAKRIINYRNKLGGFISTNQLSEVWGIKTYQIENLINSCTIDTLQISKLPINKLSVDGLRTHPYINFYQAKAIYEHRKEYGNLRSIADLKEIRDESINAEFIEKISVYCDFKKTF